MCAYCERGIRYALITVLQSPIASAGITKGVKIPVALESRTSDVAVSRLIFCSTPAYSVCVLILLSSRSSEEDPSASDLKGGQ